MEGTHAKYKRIAVKDYCTGKLPEGSTCALATSTSHHPLVYAGVRECKQGTGDYIKQATGASPPAYTTGYIMKTILHLCADTGSDSKPWKDAGYEVILVGSDIGVENYHPPADVYGIIANPVCLEFSTARSNGKARNPEKGMEIVRECQRIIAEANPTFWVIENPATGRLKDFLGEPMMTYEPWHYGSPWTKRTALWGKFNKPERKYQTWEEVSKIQELYVRPGRPKPSLAFMHKSAVKLIPEFASFNPESDMEFRSLCSQKFAQAFFEANT